MRGDQVGHDLPARRVEDAQFEQALAVRLPFRHRRHFGARHFKSSHDTFPVSGLDSTPVNMRPRQPPDSDEDHRSLENLLKIDVNFDQTCD